MMQGGLVNRFVGLALLSAGFGCGGSASRLSRTPDGGEAPADGGLEVRDAGPVMHAGGAAMVCAPLALDFGTVAAFIGAELPVICTNTGDESWQVTSLAASSAVFGAFFDPSSPSTIGPGQSLQINVTYLPTATENDTGRLTIVSSAAGVTPVVITLAGNAILETRCYYSMSPTSFNWGEVGPNYPMIAGVTFTDLSWPACSVTLTNVRLSATTSPAFTLVGVSGPQEVWTGQSVSISVAFDPPQAGAYSGAVEYTLNGVDGSLPLSGSGGASCLVIPAELDFGTNGGQFCANGKKMFVAVNGCAQDVTIQSTTLESGGPFSLVAGAVPQVVAQGGTSAPFEVGFGPKTAGTFYGSILIQTNLQTAPFVVGLQGSAVPGSLQTDTFTFKDSYEFPLSGTPDPSEGIQVTINGTALLQNDWSLAAPKNVVVIDRTVTLSPGDSVEISYHLACS
jgi:hypothetical protein